MPLPFRHGGERKAGARRIVVRSRKAMWQPVALSGTPRSPARMLAARVCFVASVACKLDLPEWHGAPGPGRATCER